MNFPHTPQSATKGGFALIITLAILVIVSALLLGFMASTQNRRIASHSYSRGAQAQEIALGALAQITGDLQSEIINNSTPLSVVSNNVAPADGSSMGPIYQPKAATNLVPMRIGIDTNSTDLVNLIRRSAVPVATATTINTDDNSTVPSADGRSISTARWNKPLFMTPTATTNLTPLGNFIPPDWIIVTRSGPQVNASGNSVNNGSTGYNAADPANTNFAVGRYAYTIYDEGGLLNVNVAGYPSTMTGSTVGGKETTVWADLTQIGMQPADITTLGQWRNPSTWAITNSYASNAINLSNSLGFTRVATGDNALISRQELINFVQTKGLPNSILPNLTTFSLALNSPSYLLPTTHAPADTNNIGIYFLNGAPLRRFPLNTRLAELYANTNSTDNLKYFGLKQGTPFDKTTFRNWTYSAVNATGGTPSATGQVILTIAQAIKSTPPREPNFFEILKTAILQGSLATQAGPGARNTNGWEFGANGSTAFTNAIDNQVIRIGANIIDQYNPDNYPTTITINGRTFYGIEDLPYFSKMYVELVCPQAPDGSLRVNTNTTLSVNAYHFFELWNPHQAPTAKVTGPTMLRIRVDPTSKFGPGLVISGTNGNTYVAFPGAAGGTWLPIPATKIAVNTNTTDYRLNPQLVRDDPTTLTNLGGQNVSSIVSSNSWNNNSTTNMGQVFVPTSWTNTVVYLEYSADGTNYYPYTTLSGLAPVGAVQATSDGGITTNGNSWINASATNGTNGLQPYFAFMKPDPRTDRLGISANDGTVTNMFNLPMIPSVGAYTNGGFSPNGGLSTYINNQYPGTLVCNTGGPKQAKAYDNDGAGTTVARPGDAFLNESTADPMTIPNARPVILHRAFRSVAELGYAFRDQPWKTLNFFSTNSADAALLDVFCLTDTDTSPAPTTGPDTRNNLIAGQIDLNTRNSQALAALLSGTISQNPQGVAMNSNDALTIATSLTTFTANNPIASPAELVTQCMSNSVPYSPIKQQRETIVRALASTGQTRTWNLLVDVIAQSGRFPTTATTLNKFQVEGERRYWLHLAIDRPTGKVISEVLEPVTE